MGRSSCIILAGRDCRCLRAAGSSSTWPRATGALNWPECQNRATMPAMPNTSIAAFRPLTGVYEPSAIQQLPDGRFLVVEDEKAHPFSLVTLGDDEVSAVSLRPGLFEFDAEFLWRLNQTGSSIIEIYIPTRHRIESKFKMSQSMKMLKNIIKVRFGLM